MLTILEKADLLHETDFFGEVRTRSLARIAAIAGEMQFQAKQRLFSENESPDAMYVLLEGEVSLTRNGVVESTLSRFQCAGAHPVFSDQPHSKTAVAGTLVQVLRIPQESLFNAMAEDFNITRGILRAFARHK